MADPCINFDVDFVECALERGIDGAKSWDCSGKAGTQNADVSDRAVPTALVS